MGRSVNATAAVATVRATSIASIRGLRQYCCPFSGSTTEFSTMTSIAADTVVIVTSFERPHSLRRSLLSLSVQAAREHLAEVIVADDGSRDETWQVVDSFARQTQLPMTFTTHVHGGFQPGRSRNEAVACSTAPYLAFLDGDCVVPTNFLATHVARRRAGVALCGESYRLTPAESDTFTDELIHSGDRFPTIGRPQQRRMAKKAFRDRIYSFLRVPMRPRLTGNHFSLWRADFERVNGFDLGYLGWGLEDCDLQRRLLRVGVRCRTVLPATAGYHLWHPKVESFVRKARNTPNEAHYLQSVRADGYATPGLREVERDAICVWKWRRGNLIELPQSRKHLPALAS